jgi:hypothetical protein
VEKKINVFITDLPDIGGIYTNYVNLIKELDDSFILCLKHEKNIYENRIWINISEYFSLVNESKEKIRFNLFVSSPRGLLFFYLFFLYSFIFKKKYSIYPIFLTYHQKEFSCNDSFSKIYRKYIMAFGSKNIWFMNSNCFESHNLVVKNLFEPIYLNIITSRFNSQTSIINNICTHNHILTVGRLVDFKISYIENLIKYVSIRPYLKLTIVGDGPERKRIIDLIDYSTSNNIDLVGTIEYEKLQNYYRNCSFFVGMGTTLLEAAFFNKMCVVAIAGKKTSFCYGWFHFLTDFNVGEQCKNQEYDLFNFLDYAFGLNENEYNLLLEQQQIHLKKFSIEETLIRFDVNLSKTILFHSGIFSVLGRVIIFSLFSFYAIIQKKIFNYSRYNSFN